VTYALLRCSCISVNLRMTLSVFFYRGRKCKCSGRRRGAERHGMLAGDQRAAGWLAGWLLFNAAVVKWKSRTPTEIPDTQRANRQANFCYAIIMRVLHSRKYVCDLYPHLIFSKYLTDKLGKVCLVYTFCPFHCVTISVSTFREC
jgi:hypothetical protein